MLTFTITGSEIAHQAELFLQLRLGRGMADPHLRRGYAKRQKDEGTEQTSFH